MGAWRYQQTFIEGHPNPPTVVFLWNLSPVHKDPSPPPSAPYCWSLLEQTHPHLSPAHRDPSPPPSAPYCCWSPLGQTHPHPHPRHHPRQREAGAAGLHPPLHHPRPRHPRPRRRSRREQTLN